MSDAEKWESKDYTVFAHVNGDIDVVCWTAASKKRRTPKNAKRAKLIAAAPDLLAACNRALTFFGMKEILSEANRAASLLDTLHNLRAAIAKATGN